jgi:hypothetical protein
MDDLPSQSPDRPSGQQPAVVGVRAAPGLASIVAEQLSPSCPPSSPCGSPRSAGSSRWRPSPRRGGRLRRGCRPGGPPAAARAGTEPRRLSHRPAPACRAPPSHRVRQRHPRGGGRVGPGARARRRGESCPRGGRAPGRRLAGRDRHRLQARRRPAPAGARLPGSATPRSRTTGRLAPPRSSDLPRRLAARGRHGLGTPAHVAPGVGRGHLRHTDRRPRVGVACDQHGLRGGADRPRCPRRRVAPPGRCQ